MNQYNRRSGFVEDYTLPWGMPAARRSPAYSYVLLLDGTAIPFILDSMFSYIVILAGGSGTRLWPASTSGHPKQFMALQDGSSFFRKSLDRAFALRPERGVLVVTGDSQANEVVRECGTLRPGKPGREDVLILPEPEGKNTAPAIAYALAAAEAEGAPPDASMLLMTSDHVIDPMDAFISDAGKAETLAEAENLVCFGIPPRYAATGYGYIEASGPLGPGFKAAGFREKPDKPTAENFLASGKFFWNSGMYAFRIDVMKREMAAYAPEIPRSFEALQGHPVQNEEEGALVVRSWKGLSEAYSRTPAISLDYAVSEKSRRVALVEASFKWDDVGSWDEMARLFPQNRGDVYSIESEDCFVYSDIPVALCGVSDLTVVIRNGVALVLRKGSAQLVKEAVAAVKSAGKNDLI